MRNEFPKARLFLDPAEYILNSRLSIPDQPAWFVPKLTRLRCLLSHHKGRLACSEGLHEQARENFHECLSLCVEEREPESKDYMAIQAAAYHGIGDVERKVGNYTQSTIWYEMSIKALQHTQEKSEKYLLTARVVLGLSLLLDEKPEAAESILEQARWHQSAQGIEDEIPSATRFVCCFRGEV